MKRWIAALLLVGACTGQTWQESILECYQVAQDQSLCDALAGNLIRRGCQREAYDEMVASRLNDIAFGKALAAVTLKGLCPAQKGQA